MDERHLMGWFTGKGNTYEFTNGEEAIRHGGYGNKYGICLHWKDEGVALIPQESFLTKKAVRNVSGKHVFFQGSALLFQGKCQKTDYWFLKRKHNCNLIRKQV